VAVTQSTVAVLISTWQNTVSAHRGIDLD